MSFTILPATLNMAYLPRVKSGERTVALTYTVREPNGAEYKATHYWSMEMKRKGAYPKIKKNVAEMLFFANCHEKIAHKIPFTAAETKTLQKSPGTILSTAKDIQKVKKRYSCLETKVLVKEAPKAAMVVKPATIPPAISADLIAQSKALQARYKALSDQIAAGGKTLAVTKAEADRLLGELKKVEAEQVEILRKLASVGLKA